MKKIVSCVLIATASLCASVAHATPSLSFLIDGDTFGSPYSINNTSTMGEKVTRFVLDLSTIATGGPFCFDTVNGGACNPSPQAPRAFAAQGNSATVTGLVSPASVADGSTVLDLNFIDFNAGETFIWDIDVDSASAVTVLGNSLIGATATVYFSNGQAAFGTLRGVPGNSDASQFSIDIVRSVPEPTTLALFGLAGLALLRRRKQA